MSNKTANVLWMWIARISATVLIAMFLYHFFSEEITRLEDELSIETGPVYFMVFSVLIGYLISWFIEVVGGLVLTVGGLALGVYAFMATGANTHMTAVIYTVPFAVPGFFFLVSWYKRS
jgi:hypothetical protein